MAVRTSKKRTVNILLNDIMGKNRRLLLVLFSSFVCISVYAEKLLYPHPDLHILFTIDTETKEATIGNEIYQENEDRCNAFYNYQGVMKELDIPSTITCTGTAMSFRGYFDENDAFHYYWDDVDISNETYTVTAVARKAFYKSPRIHNIETIKLPETIREIGEYAFSWCIYLKSFNIPHQVTAIKDGTFWYCKIIEKFELPENVLSIGYQAFSDCENLKEINIPGKCLSIDNDAFTWCPNLHKVTIENGTDPLSVGYCYSLGLNDGRSNPKESKRALFADCSIDTLYLGRNIVYPRTSSNKPLSPFEASISYMNYGGGYYYNSTASYKKLEFGETLTEIADSLFYNVSLKNCNLKFSEGLKRIGKDAFYWNVLRYITPRRIELPHSVEYIGENAFRENCLSEIILHEGIKTIGKNAFSDNVLTSLTIPSTVTDYGDTPFKNNKIDTLSLSEGLKVMCSIPDAKIVKLTIPASMESINGSFGDMLRFVNCKPVVPPSGGGFGDAVVYVPSGTGKIYRENHFASNIVDPGEEILTINVRKAGSLYSRILAQDYQLADVYRLKLKGSLNQDDIATIANMPCLYDIDLSELQMEEFPKGFLQSIKRLNKITLPNVLQNIGDSAFVGCNCIGGALGGSLNLPVSCKSVGKRAFYGTSIERFVCNSSIEVKDEAFAECSFLKEVVLKEGSKIGNKSFAATDIEEICIPADVLVEDSAFMTSSLKRVIFDGGGQDIGNNVFSKSVERFTFNGALLKIGTFSSDVKEIFVDDIRTWCALPFTHPVKADCLYINGEEAKNIVIPGDVISLRNHIFYECPTIHSVQLPNIITEIPECAFKGCANLSTVNLPAKLKVIRDSAFADCHHIQEIDLPSRVESIGSSSFENCTSLSKIGLPASLATIGRNALLNCTSLSELNLPENLRVIEKGAFGRCTSLEKLDFPASVVSIGSGAFYNCTGVTLIVTHWKEPITVSDPGTINENGYLYVPIGLSQKYANAGWNFQNLKERGVMTIRVSNGGKVICDEVSVSDNSTQLYFPPYRDISVTLNPEEGYDVVKAIMNGKDVLTDLENGELFIEEPEEDVNLYVVFGTEGFIWGDVNGDHVLNDDDVITVANKIIKNNPSTFYKYAADMNDDGVINITDIILIIKEKLSR